MKNKVLKLIIILNIFNIIIFAKNKEFNNIKGLNNNEVSDTKQNFFNQTLFDCSGPIFLQDNYGRFHPILIAAILGLVFNYPRKVKIPLSVMYAMIYRMDNENKVGAYIKCQFQKKYEELEETINNSFNKEN